MASTYVPLLAGRRMLLTEAGSLMPRDWAERKAVERVLVTSDDAEVVRRAAQRYRVRYLAIDTPMREEYEVQDYADLARSAAHRTVFQNAAVRIVEILPADDAPGPGREGATAP
jgi:hypothetical protein